MDLGWLLRVAIATFVWGILLAPILLPPLVYAGWTMWDSHRGRRGSSYASVAARARWLAVFAGIGLVCSVASLATVGVPVAVLASACALAGLVAASTVSQRGILGPVVTLALRISTVTAAVVLAIALYLEQGTWDENLQSLVIAWVWLATWVASVFHVGGLVPGESAEPISVDNPELPTTESSTRAPGAFEPPMDLFRATAARIG